MEVENIRPRRFWTWARIAVQRYLERMVVMGAMEPKDATDEARALLCMPVKDRSTFGPEVRKRIRQAARSRMRRR